MKKKKYSSQIRVKSDLAELMLNRESDMYCDHCQMRLGILHTLRYALFKKKGAPYFVPCRYCKELNRRVKGEIKEHLNNKWEKLENSDA